MRRTDPASLDRSSTATTEYQWRRLNTSFFQRGARMARRKNSVHDSQGLFEEEERLLTRRIRRQRALFIPHFLREAAESLQLQGAAQARAYEKALHWADLETKGHLPQYKETSIDTQFLDQLFVAGLGYQLKTMSPDTWQLEHKF